MTRAPVQTSDAVYSALESCLLAQRRMRERESKLAGSLSQTQYRILRAIVRDGPMSAGSLAATTGVTAAAATQAVDGLERRDLVTRMRSDADRRQVRIDVTTDGRALAERWLARNRRRLNNALEGLTGEELANGVEILRRCAEYLDSI